MKKGQETAHGRRLPALIVWGAWGSMAVGAGLYLACYGHNVPYYDDWAMVPVLDGAQPVDTTWLWDARNGHRIPIPKLVLLGLLSSSGWDFRVGMYVNALLLAVLAWALVRVAADRPGGVSITDAFFPLVLLHWGHYENLLWTWQVTQVLPVVIVLALLVLMARSDTQLDERAAGVAGLGVIALPLCGVAGLAYVPGFALWLAEAGRRSWLSGSSRGRRAGLIAWGLVAVAVLVVPAYFLGFSFPSMPSARMGQTVKTMGAFVAQGFGPATSALQPWAKVAGLGLMLASLAVLLPRLRDADEAVRSRAWGLVLFLAAFSGLAVTVGVARPSETFAPRYALFAVPGLCWVYLTWDRFSPLRLARLARTALLLLAIVAAGLGARDGLEYAKGRHARLQAFEADVRDGKPPSELIARHQRTLLPFPEDGGRYWHESLGASFDILRRHEIGVFRALSSEASFREVPLASMATVEEPPAPMSPGRRTVTWTLNQAAFVQGVRVLSPVTIGAATPTAPPTTVLWRRRDQDTFSKDRRYVHWWNPQEAGATFWLYDSVYALRIELDDPSGAFSPPDVTLLLADTERNARPQAK